MPVLTKIGRLATCRPEGPQDQIHQIRSAALAWDDGKILWAGPEADLPSPYRTWEALDAGGNLVIPGLIDSHTHLAFGGWRADEFAQRLAGRSYLDIAAAGGGIASTVRDTRALSEEALLERCRSFVKEIVPLGVTTLECKSGYGLSLEDELKILRVYRQLAEEGPLRIVSTFLGAHVVPPEYRERRADYLALLTDQLLPRIAAEGLAEFCDVFVEESAFSVDEARALFRVAGELGLRAKVHADQMTDGRGAELAAEVNAVSAEHLECISEEGIRALAEAGVVAVSLPVATLYLGQSPPPARRMIEAGVSVAVATDFNPGTAPSFHLPLAMTLACTRQRMTPTEVLKGATLLAARAVGREATAGSLEAGKVADFALIDAPDVETWLYHFRGNACLLSVVAGEVCWRSPGGN
jgi:imidazolonepropionase